MFMMVFMSEEAEEIGIHFVFTTHESIPLGNFKKVRKDDTLPANYHPFQNWTNRLLEKMQGQRN